MQPKGLQTESPVYAITVHDGEDKTKPHIVYIVKADGTPLECMFETDPDWHDVDSRDHFWPKIVMLSSLGATNPHYEMFHAMAVRAEKDTLASIMADDAKKLIDRLFEQL